VNQAALIEHLRQSTSFLWLVLVLAWVVSALRTKRTVQSLAFGVAGNPDSPFDVTRSATLA
jgi:uncharacterized membrane protein